MTRLAELRSQLETVVARRRTARRVIGVSAVLLALVWCLAAFFLLDWLFSLGRLERAFTLLLIGGAVGAAYWFLAKPWLWRREDELDVALLVEKQRGIDSDLVAALEFERPEAQKWGSPELREAVIEYVTDYGREWNLLADFPRDQMKRRALMVGVTLLIAIVVTALLPEHVFVMLNRLALGSMHYPTRTRIVEIALGDQTFPLTRYGQHNIAARRPFGEEVELTLKSTSKDKEPPQGTVRLRGMIGGAKTVLTLDADANEPGVYRARLPQLVDTLAWTVELGDARTDPATLEVVPLPVVEVTATATPPQYAKNRVGSHGSGPTTRRQLSVFEGSKVDLRIECGNKKLKSAVVKIDKAEFPMTEAELGGRVWELAAAKTPLAEVTAPVSYAIEVRDEDGLTTERPLEGTIGVEIDRPPQAELQLVTRKCLPGAAPKIDYVASDDFGVSAVLLHAKIRRGSSEKVDEVVRTIWKVGQPTRAKGLPMADQYQLDLLPLNLAPGDQVALSLEVQDFRGGRKAQSAMSAPELVAITDKAAVDSAIFESDARGEQLFGDIISRLTGTEEKR